MLTPSELATRARAGWTAGQAAADLARDPGRLWHYTDAGGLSGIVESEGLWATNTRFLNDATELGYGLQLAGEFIRTYSSTARLTPEASAFLRGLADPEQADVTGFLRRNLDVYVACFCEDGDLLSQWRAYAGTDTAGGYALSFETGSPLQAWVHAAGGAHGLRLVRVLYDRDEQEAVLHDLLNRLVPVLEENSQERERKDAVASNLVDALAAFAASCKDSAFAEEREWRIVYDRSNDADPLPLSHRATRGLLVPYVALDLRRPEVAPTGHLPLASINCGPGPEPVLKEQGLRSRLSRHEQFANLVITGSLTPLRL